MSFNHTLMRPTGKHNIYLSFDKERIAQNRTKTIIRAQVENFRPKMVN